MFFSEAEAADQLAYFDQLLATAAAKGYDSYAINGWHKYCEPVYDLVTDSRILDYVQDLLGEDLICLGYPLLQQNAGRWQARELASGCVILAAHTEQDGYSVVGYRRR